MKRTRAKLEANRLIEGYNEYIQSGMEENKGTGWCPVCIDEFEVSEWYKNWLEAHGFMTVKEAFEIVLELAQQATLNEDDADNDVLQREREREIEARNVVEDFVMNNVLR